LVEDRYGTRAAAPELFGGPHSSELICRQDRLRARNIQTRIAHGIDQRRVITG
jgi:hypothetical protein